MSIVALVTLTAAGREPGLHEAVAVARRYYDLIEAHRFGEARRLWGEGGARSGRSFERFSAQFGRFSDYHAKLGVPGRGDAGMSQRWVEVPVKLWGRTRTGKRFRLAGTVTLHRVIDIDGATAEQKRWRIARIVAHAVS